MSDIYPDSLQELSDLLAADLEPLVTPFSDKTPLVRAVQKNRACLNEALTKLKGSGLPASEAYQALVLETEQELQGLHDWGELSNLADLQKANAYLLQHIDEPEGLFLTDEAARKLLEVCVPTHLLQVTGSATLDQLYEHYAPLTALALTRHTEEAAWQKRYHALLKDVSRQDFEKRKVSCLTIDTTRHDIELWNTHSPMKPWWTSHSKETGNVISFTRPKDVTVPTPRLLHTLVFFHYFVEAAAAGQFVLLAAQETPGTLGQRLVGVITSAEDKFTFFYANLFSEDLFWRRAYRAFLRAFPVRHGPFFLEHWSCGGYTDNEKRNLLSLNIIDRVWDINITGTKETKAYFNDKKESFYYHFREARWSETFRDLLGLSPQTFEEAITRYLDTGDRFFSRMQTGLYARTRWQEHFLRLAKQSMFGFLRRSERFTKTDMVYLVSSGGWLGVGHAVSVLSGFLLTLLFANFLDPEVYGTYSFLLSIAGILSAAALPGMLTALIVSTAKGRGNELETAFWSRIRWGLAGSVGALALALYYSMTGETLLAGGAFITALFLPVFEATTLFQGYWNGLRRFAVLTGANSIVRIGATVLIAATVLLAPHALAILLAYFIGYSALRLGAYWFARKEAGPGPGIYEARSTLAFGKHLSVMTGFSLVANHLDKILIFYFLGPVSVAAYTIAISVPEQIRSVFRNLALIALPKLAAATYIPRLTTHALRLLQLAGAGMLALVVYVIAAPYLFSLLFPAYASSAIYSQIAAVALVLIATISVLPTTTLKAHEATRELYTHTIFVSVVRIALIVALVPFYGIWGALAALVIHQVVVLVSSMYLLYFGPKFALRADLTKDGKKYTKDNAPDGQETTR